MKDLKTYWFSGKVNFGDLLTRDILCTMDINPIHSKLDSANFIGVGSVLGWTPDNFSGYIIGSGLMRPTQKNFSDAMILSVRGELTRQCLQLPKNIPLGDPGLISDKLLERRSKKKYVLGLIPHFENKDDEKIISFLKKYPDDVLLIDVERQPIDVISEMDECQFIASSSLHGLIVADSLGIPNIWLYISKSVGGGRFKFQDYGTAIGEIHKPYTFIGTESLSELISKTRTPPTIIDELKNDT